MDSITDLPWCPTCGEQWYLSEDFLGPLCSCDQVSPPFGYMWAPRTWVDVNGEPVVAILEVWGQSCGNS